MKLGQVPKPDKRNTETLKKFDDEVMSANCDVIIFFRFMANLQPPGSRTPDTWSINLTYSLTITIYLTKTEGRTKKISNTALVLLL